jgi:hypothetical protein
LIATAADVSERVQPNSPSSGSNIIEVVDLKAAALIRAKNVTEATTQAKLFLLNIGKA